MAYKHKPTLIERIAESVGVIPNLHEDYGPDLDSLTEPGDLTDYPPPEKWDNWEEYEAKGWAKKGQKNLTLSFRQHVSIASRLVGCWPISTRKMVR